ncbi:DUF421 domain-containing protein [Mucilaginibacter terrenus]|uniref:DUF421 domain-containing protein n=1 Tax=Mucilaginibacter terrenus TaxID=2482727 RepID=A0A3E2NTS2_9SPHI|nr:YetF domain-containing protein [Mucilaginibacter terrenus]RFZ84406.1 DUF421 domain-containing protein [Mucilaginibacter terrenus]
MKKEAIHFDDIYRILIGNAPPIFLLEVFLRTLVIYVTLLFAIRWLGKRMSGQLTIMELAVMLTLGAIICVPMQIPDRGLLQGIVLLICAVWLQRGVSYLGVKSTKIEDFTQGKLSMLIKNGVLELDELRINRISHNQLFSQLRQLNVFNLGELDRVYLEANGVYSIFKSDEPRPGLPILHVDDAEIVEKQQHAGNNENENKPLQACTNCGNVQPEQTVARCGVCGNDNWIKAIV